MKKNKLIILGGFAGAGKTTIAERLGKHHNLPFFNPDDFNAGLMNNLKKPFHELSPLAYDVLWHIIKKNLAMNVTCILDSNMCNIRTWETVDVIQEEFPTTEIIPIILMCDLETHKKRIKHRGQTNSKHLNLGGDSFDEILHKYEFINALDRPDIIRVDANGSVDDVYQRVVTILELS